MRFKKIKFDNYRCFLNGEIEFSENDGKNINLILGNNGAGKTEVLFAFWWLLYGFNFKQLKNKEATPYALNFSLYKSIQDGERNSASCSVEAEIEDGDTTYIVNRTAKYEKKPTTIAVTESQSVRYYKENYELSLPVRDEAEVNKMLTRIIPKPILNGIVFDGERMKQLSSLDDSSVKAIAGVINDITNVELLEQCHLTFEQVQKAINKKAKQIAKAVVEGDASRQYSMLWRYAAELKRVCAGNNCKINMERPSPTLQPRFSRFYFCFRSIFCY